MSGRVENLEEKHRVLYRWHSTPDSDGDELTVRNAQLPGVVITAGNDKQWGQVLIDEVEARELAILDLLTGKPPTPVEADPWRAEP